jgi:adenylate cyclase
MALALIELRLFDEAVAVSKTSKLVRWSSLPWFGVRVGALGRDKEARETAARVLEVDPAFTISGCIARGGQSNAKLLIEGLRKAGLPE